MGGSQWTMVVSMVTLPWTSGGFIYISDMQSYCEAQAKGKDPIIPQHTDVVTKLGKNFELWWAGLEKRMQMELISGIFNVVFNTTPDCS